MKGFFFLLCLLSGNHFFAQDIVLIDTINIGYRTSLNDLYGKRIAEQESVFHEKITDRKLRTEVISIYKGFTKEFTENIQKGYFVDEEKYRSFIDGILEKLVENNPEYSSLPNTKIVLSYGTSPNAYAVGNEVIVLYLSLLKQLRNEYELAFIISHEIAHNILEHSYNGIVKNAELKLSEEIKKRTKEIERKKYNKAGEAIELYRNVVYGTAKNRRQFEHQADSLGFVLFKNAFGVFGYEAVKSLELLNEIDRERDSLTTEDFKRFFDTEKLPFKYEWINNKELSNYKYDKTPKFWTIDSLKTHPDCTIRAEYIKTNFSVEVSDLQEASAVFMSLKKSSRYNDVVGLYAIKEYGKSLYETLILLKNEPGNAFLKEMVYNNLLKLQEAQNSYTLNRYLDVITPSKSDSYNTFLYFIRQLRRSEMSALINHYKKE